MSDDEKLSYLKDNQEGIKKVVIKVVIAIVNILFKKLTKEKKENGKG